MYTLQKEGKKSKKEDLPPKERVKRARTRLLREKPFFGYALMYVKIVSKDEPKPPGPKIVYSEKFVENLKDDELMGVLCHELLHYLLGHIKRAKEARKRFGAEKDKQYYTRMNIAEDIVVNALLVKNGFTLPRTEIVIKKDEEAQNENKGSENKDNKTEDEKREVRQGAIVPEYDYQTDKMYVSIRDAKGKVYTVWEPEKKSTEEVYWEIKDFEVGDEEECDDDNDTMYFSDDTTDDCENGSGKDSDGNGSGEESDNGENGRSNISSRSPQELMSEAYIYAKMHGKEPAGIERFVKIGLKPKVNWKVLRRYVIQMIPYDYTFFKPSKKSPPNIILPGIAKSEHLEGIVAVDTSGSIDEDELSEFFAEINWIVRNFRSIKITLVSCDAEIHTIEEIRSKFELGKFTPKGGGGTDFRPVFDLAVKRKAKLIIYFTDGYGTFPEKPPNIPTIWIVSRRGAPESHFPFGKVIKM